MLGSRLTYQKQPWEGERTASDWQGENFRTLAGVFYEVPWCSVIYFFYHLMLNSKTKEVFIFSFFTKGGCRKGDYPSYKESNLFMHPYYKAKAKKQLSYTIFYPRVNWCNVNLIAIATKFVLVQAVSIFIDMDESGGRANEWIYK